MTRFFRSLVATAVVAVFPLILSAEPLSRLPLLQTNSGQFDASTATSNSGGTWTPGQDGKSLTLTTPAGKDWPGIMFKAPAGKWDLSAYEYISVDLHNEDTKDIDVFVRVDNPGADGLKNCISERTFVAPDQRTTLTIPIKRISDSPIKLWGMQGYPQGLYPDKVGLDATNVVAIVVYTGRSTPTSNRFEVSNVYAAGKYVPPTWLGMSEKEFFPFVDKYGQFMHKDWPGKIKSDEELVVARDAEAKTLAADTGPADWDKYGGFAKGPQLEATGHFRTQKVQDKWWLVDPDGHLFFSTGITGVGPGWASTPIEDRDNWFADLPARDGPMKEFFGKTYKSWSGHYAGKEPVVFDFASANLQRKYGEKWRTVYPDVVHQRLRAWGINTMANWSSRSYEAMDRTPYTAVMFYSSPRKLRNVGSGFPDPFDPAFAKNLAAGAKQWLTGVANDPWCIGYFVDNEMPWGGDTTLAIEALKAPADQPAKIEMIKWLQSIYPTIDDLNKAWGTQFAGYDKLPVGKELKSIPSTKAALEELTDFTDIISERYLKEMRDATKGVAPNKLYLGCRSVGGSVNVMAMQAKYCDVISMNRYCHQVEDVKLPGGIDAPVVIGEFHFGASDRGLFSNGLVSTDDQTDRGRKYAAYVNSALDNPQIVGVHWFQYGDEAVTGRGDGENAQCGFVDVCDTPYAETIAASRETAKGMYPRRLGPTK